MSWPEARRTGNGTAEPGPSPGRSRRRSPKDAGARGGRHREADEAAPAIGASRFEAGFHETPHGGVKVLRSRGSAEPEKAAGIAPRLEPAGRRRGLAPEPRPETGMGEASASSVSGRAGRLRPSVLRRATGRASAPMRAWDRPASARRFRQGKRRRDFGPAEATRRGSVRGFRASPETHRDPNGASRPRCGIRGKRSGREPRRNPEAAQREMASPPSDGSQGWDKWGPVATPAPIIVRASNCRAGAARTFSCRAPDPRFFWEKARRRKGTKRSFAPLGLLLEMGPHGAGFAPLIPS